jgi:hypothetical protein
MSLNRWINIEPVVEDDSRGETPGLFSWVSARGPQVPVGTLFFEGEDKLVSLGNSHGTGRNASDILEYEGIQAPEKWQIKQDPPHPGFVRDPPKEEPPTKAAAQILVKTTYPRRRLHKKDYKGIRQPYDRTH